MLIGKSSFSICFQLVSAYCVIQAFRKTENFDISARKRKKQRGKNENKSNDN